MNTFRRVFLFCVGAVAIAYEELARPLRRQKERLTERFGLY